MSNRFAIGDIVQLKSGGPKMTVQKMDVYYGEDSIQCQWFSGTKLQGGRFHPEILVKVEESDE